MIRSKAIKKDLKPLRLFGTAAMHLRHSLRKLELAQHDFGVFLSLSTRFIATTSPKNIAIVEMRLNQGFVDKICNVAGGTNCLNRLISAIPEAIFFSQLLDMTASGKVCINEYT